MKTTFLKYLLLILAGFVLLFLLRLGYGYWKYPDGRPPQGQYIPTEQGISINFDSGRNNYASTKYKGKGVTTAPTGPQAYDQKYEKVGTLGAKSSNFDEDVNTVKGLIKDYNGLIQYEQQGGLSPSRYLHLAIGVPPENFDAAVDALKNIGKLTSIRIDKSDKTNEYQKLKAKRATLEAHLESLMNLKSQSGKIEEYMELEEKIEHINQQLQDLGVSLGEFDSQNEFCTVKFTLSEIRKVDYSIPLPHRLMTAFTWTVQYYAVLMIALFAGASLLWILASLLGKAKSTFRGNE